MKDVGLNCLCVQFTDIVVLIDELELAHMSEEQLKTALAQDKLLRTKRAFCLMFTNNLYHMHMNLLSAILEITKKQ